MHLWVFSDQPQRFKNMPHFGIINSTCKSGSAVHIQKHALGYENLLDDRDIQQIELLVIHCTELPDLATARSYGEVIHYSSGTGNSGHYYVDRNGEVHQWVKPEKVAHHVRGHNKQSVGIELINSGRYPDWHDSRQQVPTEAYPDEQITALVALIKFLQVKLPNLKHIAGHEDLDQNKIPATNDPAVKILRKIDPGPLFPWDHVMQQINLINIGSHAKKYE